MNSGDEAMDGNTAAIRKLTAQVEALVIPKRPPPAALLTDHPDRIVAVLDNARCLVGAMGGSPELAKGVAGCLAAAEALTRHWEQVVRRLHGITTEEATSPPAGG